MVASLGFGLVGVVPFLLGAASSSGGIFRFLVFPALLFREAMIGLGLEFEEVELNRWAVIAQFLGYFLVAMLVLSVVNQITSKHNKKSQPTANASAE